MRNISLLISVLVCFLAWITTCQAACYFQQCICNDTYMICRDRQAQTGQNVSLPPLTIDLNIATELPANILASNLTEIYLTNSPITVIDEHAFDESATTLETISLTNCSLTRISDAFLHLKSLKYVSISTTYFDEWNEPAMINIGHTVETMTLSNVGLKTWPSWMRNFSNLTELDIDSSTLSSIPDDAFDLMFNSLTSLSLSNTNLAVIPKSFAKLTNLTILYLQKNKIANLTWLPPSAALATLSLNANSISDSQHLSNTLLPFANSLTILDLQDNKLTSIPSLHFLTQVGRLDFTNNRISDSVSGSLPPDIYELVLEYNSFPFIPRVISTLSSLTNLDMPSNFIRQIRAIDFCPTINQVDLEHNLVTELTDTSFPEGSRIFSLILDNNPISQISLSAFNNLASLTTLSMVNSHLQRLPLALSSLSNLGSIDLTGSSYLVCTCLEKGLEHWIMLQTAESVLGNCGQISIYDFFAMLSPDCPE